MLKTIFIRSEPMSAIFVKMPPAIRSAASQGRVIPREQIYERVWGYQMAHGDRSVDVFVRKLRRKLEAASPGWLYVHTHFGIGYRFGAVEAEGDDATAPDTSASLPPA